MIIKLSKLSWIFVLALPLFFTACDNDDDSDDPKSIVEIVEDDENFSTLKAALERTGLINTLSQDGISFTVFAPDNDAFEASNVDISTISDDDLEPILSYHVLSGAKVNAADIPDGQSYQSTASTSGPGDAALSILIEKTGSAVQLNGAINVTAADVDATNGVIHVVDRVILPLDVVGHAAANSNFTSLVATIEAASGDLDQELATTGPFTVFAPVNDAFAAITETTDDLTPEQLEQVLLYHVVGGNILSTDLENGAVTSSNDGVQFTVNLGDPVTITDAAGGTAEVVLTDVQATNGVVHVLDAVIIPDNL